MADRTGILGKIVTDHEGVKDLFGRFEQAASADEQDEVFCNIVQELAQHETAEEIVVHPKLREVGADGDEVSSSLQDEENKAEHALADLEKMEPGSDEFVSAMRQLRDDVVAHADHEERDEHPALRAQCTDDQLIQLGDEFEQAKSKAPTHPHPHAPNTKGGRVAGGPAAKVFDKMRDAVGSDSQ